MIKSKRIKADFTCNKYKDIEKIRSKLELILDEMMENNQIKIAYISHIYERDEGE